MTGLQRVILSLVELRADFEVSRAELRDADRGADNTDLVGLDRAAHQIAVVENVAVFHSWKGVITGISEASPYAKDKPGAAADDYPRLAAQAVEQLLGSGVGGPYGLALGREQYRLVIETSEHGGYPLLEHLGKILGGPIVWAPGVDGAVVLSLRGGDFVFFAGPPPADSRWRARPMDWGSGASSVRSARARRRRSRGRLG